MIEPEFVDGKAKLDKCWLCGADKKEVQYSQQIKKEPYYCVLMSEATESGPAEPYQEYDRHCFVITEKQYLAEIAAERGWFESHGVILDEAGDITDEQFKILDDLINKANKKY